MKKKRKSYYQQVKEFYKEGNKSVLFVYIFLRFLVILSLVFQLIHHNYNNVFLCALTLLLFLVPYFIDKKLKISIPNFLDIIILLFIFSAEILGEIQNFYGIFKHWDTMLHTINGFLCGAIGFSLIDILNRTENFHINLTPIFVALVSLCFSMTVGVVWEFFEYTCDIVFHTDMQKDKVVDTIYSVKLNEEGENVVVPIENITKTKLETKSGEVYEIEDGYLDIGLNDTMKDLLVNFLGALCFSVIGLLYIMDRDKYHFTEKLLPMLKKNL
ncbi:MAG: hypothetical protein ACI31M_01400 [Bacilli bacterium]